MTGLSGQIRVAGLLIEEAEIYGRNSKCSAVKKSNRSFGG